VPRKQLPAAEQALATKRIEHARDHLIAAKELLDRACRDLSDVRGGNAHWRAIRNLSDRVSEEYHHLDRIAASDHDWKIDNLSAPEHGCGERPRAKDRSAEVLEVISETLGRG
jgi:hypothetical protein